jgi:hypothetical protein
VYHPSADTTLSENHKKRKIGSYWHTGALCLVVLSLNCCHGADADYCQSFTRLCNWCCQYHTRRQRGNRCPHAGIYQRLLNAIGALGSETLKALISGKAAIIAELKRTDASFLIALAAGAGAAILASARLMSYLLENFHDPTYGFFFGLVAASLVVPWRLIRRLSAGNIVSCLIAAALVIGLTLAMSGEDRLHAAPEKST